MRRARNGFELAYSENRMKKVREITESEEPIGIIISRGDRKEARPIFSAYIWGPAPEPVADTTTAGVEAPRRTVIRDRHIGHAAADIGGPEVLPRNRRIRRA